MIATALSPVTTIRLWGTLGDRFIPSMQAHVKTLGEAMRCIFANFPDFRNYILSLDEQGYKYRVVVKGKGWETQLDPDAEGLGGFPVSGMEVSIVPVVGGSGTLGKIFIGIALIGIGVATGGFGLIIAGAAMALQGLTNSPDAPSSDDEKKQSLVFNGAATNTTEGTRIPIIGAHRYMVGVQIVSFAIKSEYVAS